MSGQEPTTHTLDVPGARLYYERRGDGPLLLIIGSPMDSGGFTGLAGVLADRYTVVTYDPRGIGNSSREDTTSDITPEQQADDVHRLLAVLDGGPAHFFGSSGGAVVGLALVTAHPGSVRTLVAHEPPLIELLPDRVERRADIDDIYQTYQAQGQDAAMQRFMSHLGLAPAAGDEGGEHEAGPPQWQPSEEELARMRATTDVLFAHLIRQTTGYQPDLAGLASASTRIVVGGGAESKGQLANRTAVALAERLGPPVVEFPGDHGGFMFHPQEFAEVLDRVLNDAA
jgi:pimeloyl-ACP methyl ester carboxylesterase